MIELMFVLTPLHLLQFGEIPPLKKGSRGSDYLKSKLTEITDTAHLRRRPIIPLIF